MADLINKEFGRLKVLYKNEEKRNGRTYWHCQCNCGVEKDIETYNLTSGRIKSCGCLNQERRHQNNSHLEGKKFFSLTVIKPSEQRGTDGSIIWQCKCDCGNICYVSTNYLRNGEKKSCGCLTAIDRKKSLQDKIQLVGEKFGKLLVLERNLDSAHWKCQCDCGNIIFVRTSSLKDGNTSSCGKCAHSKGEAIITKLLQENGIKFEREKTFEDCKNPNTNRKLRFDFYVDDRYLIEFDGEQHFFEQDKTKFEPLEEIQRRDRMKDEWCTNNNIQLLRIPYTKLKDLSFKDIFIERVDD